MTGHVGLTGNVKSRYTDEHVFSAASGCSLLSSLIQINVAEKKIKPGPQLAVKHQLMMQLTVVFTVSCFLH